MSIKTVQKPRILEKFCIILDNERKEMRPHYREETIQLDSYVKYDE